MSCEGPVAPQKWYSELSDPSHVNNPLQSSNSLRRTHSESTQPLFDLDSLLPAYSAQFLPPQDLDHQVAGSGPGPLYNHTFPPDYQLSSSDHSAAEYYARMQSAVPHGLPVSYPSDHNGDHQQVMSYNADMAHFVPYTPAEREQVTRSLQEHEGLYAPSTEYDSTTTFSPSGAYSQPAYDHNAYGQQVAFAHGSRDDPAKDEPYATLIYRALLEAPNHSMVLKDIYEWFEKNTEKPKTGTTKGWQNSIRHNLSMNQGFRKVDRNPPFEDGKKGYVWVLDEAAIQAGGVQSTTRFRKNGMPIQPRKHNRSPFPRHSLATQQFGGVHKNTARRSSRRQFPGQSPSYPDTYGSSLPTADPTPEPENGEFQVKQEAQTGLESPYGVYNVGLLDQYHRHQHQHQHRHGGQYQMLQELQRQQLSLHTNFQDVSRGRLFSPPSTATSSVAPTSPFTCQNGSGSEDEMSYECVPSDPRVAIYDRTDCGPGYHGGDCDGAACRN